MMYAIYDELGHIIKSVDCPPEHITRHVKEGHGYLQTAAHDGTHYVVDGKLVALPPKPEDADFFDYEKQEWVFSASRFKE
jgi:hypothetical protein